MLPSPKRFSVTDPTVLERNVETAFVNMQLEVVFVLLPVKLVLEPITFTLFPSCHARAILTEQESVFWDTLERHAGAEYDDGSLKYHRYKQQFLPQLQARRRPQQTRASEKYCGSRHCFDIKLQSMPGYMNVFWSVLFVLVGWTRITLSLMPIGDSNVMTSSGVKFDAARNGWFLQYNHVPAYTSIIPQICALQCEHINLQAIVTCEVLRESLMDFNWTSSSNLRFDNNSCPLFLHTELDISVDRFLDVTHPPGLFIHNNITALDAFAHVDDNGTYVLKTRVAFINAIGDDLFELRFNNLNVYVNPRENQYIVNTVGMQHECANRGLVAPPLSTMFAERDSSNSIVCMWKCALSHVRSPYNSVPPMHDDPDKHSYMCVPIPTEFTAVRFEFDVHLRVSSSGPVMLTQSFYDDLNALADQIRHEAGDAYGDSLVVLSVSGSVFEDMTLDELLQSHALNQNQMANLQIVNVAQQTRRLLASTTAIKVEGVLITPETEIRTTEEVTTLKQTVDTSAAKSIEEFQFEPAQQVVAVDPFVTTESFQQVIALSPTPSPGSGPGGGGGDDDGVIDTGTEAETTTAVWFYTVMISCAGACFLKLLYGFCWRALHKQS